jgi:leader peptidase (prepilin peptidase)/N-methyltransferase
VTSLARDLGLVGGARGIALAAALGIAAASLVISPDLGGAFGAVLGVMMLAIARADARGFIVPDPLSASALALGLVDAYFAEPDLAWNGVWLAGARAAIAAGLLLAIRWGYRSVRGREGLGLGDVKLAAVAGAWLSPTMLPISIEIAAVSAICAHAWRQWRRGRSLRALGRVPFGAYFACAIWLTWALDARLQWN